MAGASTAAFLAEEAVAVAEAELEIPPGVMARPEEVELPAPLGLAVQAALDQEHRALQVFVSVRRQAARLQVPHRREASRTVADSNACAQSDSPAISET